ncbi:HEXXH motif domain-containing protein [Streptomyces sp. GXMU-J15]|uniref:HEXXH motif domain-containing protein n=1 Tax=Streptomyces fuscus TaxID=3048495 RepID=A0ABT7J1T1_9ACTN|nr:HEXXH motif domain-containing protein [Streptomyces fuscus]MDL2078820.1 HEXXH motif domain-containing protein [Streptomyces fuscus]
MRAEHTLPHHRLPSSGLEELSCGEGGPATVDLLLAAERSRRLLLLRMLDDATDLGPAWDLLSAAQLRAPDVVDELLMYPQTGMWLATALRRLRGSLPQDEPPLSVVLGHISCLAAVAALRAELDFAIEVPVRHGRVPLPTLGCAELPTTEPWSTATLRAQAGRTTLTAPGATVTVPSPPDTPAPGWRPLRLLSLGPATHRLTLALDDIDPYRTYPTPTEPDPLSEEAAEQWRRLLERAWTVLLDEQPRTAEAMRRGLLSLTPGPARERFRPRSVTAGDAFGGIESSEPDDAVQLAVTLVHEFQHTKLGGLLHLTPLLTEEASETPELWYAPWRDDPRPLDGLLQGIYAFVGIARFWRTHRLASGAATPTAHFEFALWRTHVTTALRQVHRHERLTPVGAQLLDRLYALCTRWLDEPVPETPLALARACAADHTTRWRAHHLRPPRGAVEEAARAWLANTPAPPRSLAAPPDVVTDDSARWLDTLAVLTRHRLSGEDPEKAAVTGATPADVLLASGEAEAAQAAYLTHLSTTPDHPTAWSGLSHCLAQTRTAPTAAHFLRHHPERARAVHTAIAEATGTPPDPIALATWLAN